MPCDPMFDLQPDKKLILNEKKVNQLFDKCILTESQELTDFLNWSNQFVFITDDKKILAATLTRDGKKYYRGVLYGSEEFFKNSISKFWNTAKLVESFKPFTCEIMNEDFISEIPKSINRFQVTFNIPSDSLDYSLESLKKIDAMVKKKDMETQAKTYLDAISYLGEVVRKNVEGAAWKMTKVSEGDCRPSIVKEDKKYDPFFLYYESIFEKRPSLWEAAYIEIERNKLR